MPIRLATINLQAAQPERTAHFYRALFGFTPDEHRSQPPGFCYLRGPQCDLTVAATVTGEVPTRTTSLELGFETDDLEAMRRRIGDLGVPEVREEAMGWGDALELRDPDGHRVIIYRLHADT